MVRTLSRPRLRVRPPRSLPLFALLVATVFGLIHAVIAWRFVGAGQLHGGAATLVLTLLAALYASVPLAMASRYLGWVPKWVRGLGFSWIGVMFYWFALSLLAEPVYRFGLALRPEVAWGPMLAGGVAIVGSLFSLAAVNGAGRPALVRVDVPVPGLDHRLDGLRVAQLSDVHIGPTVDRGFVQDCVERVNAEGVDLVAITGDLVAGSVEQLRDAVAPLARLRSRHGTFFVTGNHEYYSGAPEWCAYLPELGVRVLRNERVAIEHDGALFDVAGVDDPFASAPGHGPDLDRALNGRDAARTMVLLAHQPTIGVEAARRGASLVLSGHTHGGQLWPFVHLVKLVQPLVAGLARMGDGWIYVSRGTAWWGPKMRLGAPNEITVLTLRRQ